MFTRNTKAAVWRNLFAVFLASSASGQQPTHTPPTVLNLSLKEAVQLKAKPAAGNRFPRNVEEQARKRHFAITAATASRNLRRHRSGAIQSGNRGSQSAKEGRRAISI